MFCPNCNNIFDIKDTIDEKNLSVQFVCESCETKKEIPNKTLIYEKSYKKTNEKLDLIISKNVEKSNILFNTRYYTCPNKDCESHKNIEKRKAVFFRKYNNVKIIYICKACKTVF